MPSRGASKSTYYALEGREIASGVAISSRSGQLFTIGSRGRRRDPRPLCQHGYLAALAIFTPLDEDA